MYLHILFSIILISSVTGFNYRAENTQKIRRHAACNNQQFQCASGQCIEEDYLCDGVPQCSDNSDETQDNCSKFRCPGYTFRCAYGACVSADSRCNGVKDCHDGSDEICRGCAAINNIPKMKIKCFNGDKELENCNNPKVGTIAQLKCDEPYKFNTTDSQIEVLECKVGRWNQTIPFCKSALPASFFGLDFKSLQIPRNIRFVKSTCPCKKKKTTVVPVEKFECASGESIPKHFTCDGVPHCDDASDETAKLCSKNKCPQHNYRCAYGACVSANSECNGFKECYDGSDEICSLCPSIYDSPNLKLKCSHLNRTLENCINPKNETIVELSCNELYEFNTTSKFETLKCINGMWNQTVPFCKPVCGKKSVNPETLIINGEYVKKGDYPWQAALYTVREKILFCGGSLITENIVLTAAHCVTKGSSTELIPKEQIFVAVGKYYRNFSDSRDLNFQHSAVKRIIITKEYRGILQNYLGDLALMVTEKVFKLSKNVLPVCIDWKLDFKEEFTNPSSPGTVTGWGLTTETDSPSPILKELIVPFVQYKNCNVSFDYYQYLTHDKMCAGYINNGSSVCKGDSGGGLVFPNPMDFRYYVTGIVSLSPRAQTEVGGCNSQNYGLYTKVLDYLGFMASKTSLYGVDKERCILQDHPKNGYWVVKKTSDRTYKPGMSVSNGTRVHVYCLRGFDLDGDKEVTCTNGVWSSAIGDCELSASSCVLPEYPISGHWTALGYSKFIYEPGMLVSDGTAIKAECETYKRVIGHKGIFCDNGRWNEELGTCDFAICRDVETYHKRKVLCTKNGVEIKNCTEPPHGTIAKITCVDFYNITRANNPEQLFTMNCVGSKWDTRDPPVCIPDCGVKPKDGQTLTVNGNSAIKDTHPWAISLYDAETKSFICGGTIIGEQIIITSAICVTNRKGQVKPKESFIVAVGNYYRNFNDSRDHFVQFIKLKGIEILDDYRSYRQNYALDVAFLITEDEIKYNKNSLPACGDFASLQDIGNNLPGMVGEVVGWGRGKQNGALQKLHVPYVAYKDCLSQLSEDFEQYLTQDKFCAGFYNESSACDVDLGTGLMFYYAKMNRYVFVGIASGPPRSENGTCASQQIGVYTKVQSYFLARKSPDYISKYF